jgi:uncharacterized membrane protein YkvA (DUF1232 family)
MFKWILLILAVLYTLNPFDIFPDLIVGWGWLDDLAVWILVWRFFVAQKKKYASDYRFKDSSRANYYGRHPFDEKNQHAEEGSEPWDPYRVLGIGRNASAEEIKHAYREMANRYHPDKLEHLGNEFKVLAEVRFKEIQKAYQELSGKGS